MLGTFGFSYIGLIFLSCLFIPNFLFVLYPPRDQSKYDENILLLTLERTGQILFTALVLIFSNTNIQTVDAWTIWLVFTFILLSLYLLSWLRYFVGGHTSMDFYRPFIGIPLPLATLPVAAALSLGIYSKVIWLIFAALILGIGHIGITAQNWGKIDKTPFNK